jgi:hypothetical protein
MTEEEKYYFAHKCCPVCGKETTDTTYVGYIFKENFRDDNLTKCSCGWKGKIHNLVKGDHHDRI